MAQDHELRVHRDWIGLLQPVGLVVSPPALVAAQAFPDKNIAKEQQAVLALLMAEDGQPSKPVDFATLSTTVLGWRATKLVVASELPESLSFTLPEFGETLRPTYAVPEPDGGWLLVVSELADGISFDSPPPEEGKRWQASPQVRLERLLRETGVGIGILFNRRSLRLVYAPRGESSGHVTWPLHRLVTAMDRVMLSALVMLLGSQRLFALPREQRLPHLLKESRKYQNVVSTKLAGQVLEALNELLRGFQAADEATRGVLLGQAVRQDPDHVYGGLLAVLLRLVFILYAEERGLLSQSPVFVRNYSLTGLFEKLRNDAGRFTDTMDQRYGAWSRLLVLFRMVHDGAQCGELHLPPRYGHLFDPDAWSFLEGRPYGSARQKAARVPVPKVADGVLYRVLEKLLLLDGERLSYRALDVEQIGSVYENMMGFRLDRATETSIGIGKEHVVVGLDTLLAKKGSEREKLLKEQADVELSGKASEALKSARTVDDLVAALARRISPLTSRPVPTGGLFLQPTDERRRSGSHYTPRELTEPIVRTALRPVLEDLGPSPKPAQILALKVCDPAMGSGAFLVEACRQLADALVKSYDVHGRPTDVPPDEDILLYAQRQVAQHCLYGVDKNLFAVDLGKLSLWLATLARDHAFTFLDHSIRHGDSLVGLTREQIASFHWAPEKQVPVIRAFIDKAINEAMALRAQIPELANSDDVGEKRRLLRDADGALANVRLLGDAVVASFFSGESAKEREKARARWETKAEAWLSSRESAAEIQGLVDDLRGGEKPVPCFHWKIEFPEVFSRSAGGFDAFVGNPPFLGGKLISSIFTASYERALKSLFADSKGAADIVAYFFRRSFDLLRARGTCGLLATHSVAETATRTVGLDVVVRQGAAIFEAWTDLPWPGEASVTVSRVSLLKGPTTGSILLNGASVAHITSSLTAGLDFSKAARLQHGIRYSEGTKLFGDAFVVSATDIESHCSRDPGLRQFLRHFVNGDVLNLTPEAFDGRWVADFGERELNQITGCDHFLAELQPAILQERANQTRQVHESRPWLHWDKRTKFFLAARRRPRVIACATPSKFLSFVFVDPSKLFTHSVKVFDDDRASLLCVLQSRIHELWAAGASSNLGQSVRYSTSTSFDTFPLPASFDVPAVSEAGEAYAECRTACLRARGIGPTQLYGLFHDAQEDSSDLVKLRSMHDAMDRVVLDAFGWTDLHPIPGFQVRGSNQREPDPDAPSYGRRKSDVTRYDWPEDICSVVLARLLDLNTKRAKEQAAKPPNSPDEAPAAKKKRGPQKKAATADQGALFGKESDE